MQSVWVKIRISKPKYPWFLNQFSRFWSPGFKAKTKLFLRDKKRIFPEFISFLILYDMGSETLSAFFNILNHNCCKKTKSWDISRHPKILIACFLRKGGERDKETLYFCTPHLYAQAFSWDVSTSLDMRFFFLLRLINFRIMRLVAHATRARHLIPLGTAESNRALNMMLVIRLLRGGNHIP